MATFFQDLLDIPDKAKKKDHVQSSDYEAGGSDSGWSRSGRSNENERSKSDELKFCLNQKGADFVVKSGRLADRSSSFFGSNMPKFP